MSACLSTRHILCNTLFAFDEPKSGYHTRMLMPNIVLLQGQHTHIQTNTHEDNNVLLCDGKQTGVYERRNDIHHNHD